MLEQLFGSKTRFNLLRFLFHNSDDSFFVRELSRALNSQVNAVRREINLLKKLDILIEEDKKDNGAEHGASLRKYYSLNKDALIYPELEALILKADVLVEKELIDTIKNKGGDIKLLLMTGAFTKDTTVSVDILLVGDIKERNIAKIITDYEKKMGREVKYTIMNEKEFRERRHIMDKFIFSIFEAKHEKIINEMGM